MSKGNRYNNEGGGETNEIDDGGDADVQVLLETSGELSRLVPDVFLNIMSRVPLNSLSQCKWVSKSWYKLIKSPSFAKIQYEWAIKNNSPCLFFWDPCKESCLVDDQVFENLETSATAYALAHEFPETCQIAGYVNGLVCVASDPECYTPSSIYICNPVTGEYLSLPKSPKYEKSAIVAFGFDPATDEYKVIRFMDFWDEDGKYLRSESEVYTLGSSGWRTIEDVPHIMDTEQYGVYLNGNLHWIPYPFKYPIIDTFIVGSEKFDVIQPPIHMLQIDSSLRRLVVLEGHLCFIHKKSDYSFWMFESGESGDPYEIWVMEDYGVQSSWVKKYSFCSKISKWKFHGSHDLIKLRNGELLLQVQESENEFMGYLDPVKDTLRRIRIVRHDEAQRLNYYFRSVLQVGSLFSPKDVGKSRRSYAGGANHDSNGKKKKEEEVARIEN